MGSVYSWARGDLGFAGFCSIGFSADNFDAIQS
jgi:hypothetical protein